MVVFPAGRKRCTRITVEVLAHVAENGGQAICATHSPLITALPGATILQLDDDGFRPVAWSDLEIVDHWRAVSWTTPDDICVTC